MKINKVSFETFKMLASAIGETNKMDCRIGVLHCNEVKVEYYTESNILVARFYYDLTQKMVNYEHDNGSVECVYKWQNMLAIIQEQKRLIDEFEKGFNWNELKDE